MRAHPAGPLHADIQVPGNTAGARPTAAAELDALAGRRPERRAALRDRGSGTSRRREKHILLAARDLAHDLCASGGADGPAVEHSRAEIARLRGL